MLGDIFYTEYIYTAVGLYYTRCLELWGDCVYF